LVDMAGRYSFSDGYIGCVFCGWASPPPPCPQADTAVIYLTLGLGDASCANDNCFGIDDDHTGCTKGGAMLMSRIGRVKKRGVRRQRETISAPSEVIGELFFTFLFFHVIF
jgi:hypothetical protein